MNKRERAKRLLLHYFKLCAENSGIRWESDLTTEVESIVDLLIDAAKEELREEAGAK